MTKQTSPELQLANDLIDRRTVDLDQVAETIRILYFKNTELQASVITLRALFPADGKLPKQCLHQIAEPAATPADAVRSFRDYIGVHDGIKLGVHAMDNMALDLARIALDFKHPTGEVAADPQAARATDFAEVEHARRAAENLALSLFKKHYASNEGYASGRIKFELADTLRGVLSQIDNMTCGLKAPAAAPVVLPEPDLYMDFCGNTIDAAWLKSEASSSDYRNTYTQPVYTDQRMRALLAGVSAPAAQAINLLAADHSSMKVDYRGLFSQVQRAIKRSGPGYAEMLRQLEDHLQELGQRWYAGDTNVVDEFLQLYCIERDARKTVRQDAAAAPQAQAVAFQQRVQPWMMACFGPEISADRIERNHRFLEEALELVQSLGCTASEAHQLVDYVFGRPVGEPVQEAGGVMVTLAALCLASGLDMHACGETELARIWTKVEAIRAKQAAKPKHSPLPMHAPQAQADARDAAPAAGVPAAAPDAQLELDAARYQMVRRGQHWSVVDGGGDVLRGDELDKDADEKIAARSEHARVTPEGRTIGTQVAQMVEPVIQHLVNLGEPDERCKSCAFRAGTVPNGCLQTMGDVAKAILEQKPFWCHVDHYADGRNKICSGWLASMWGAEGRPIVPCTWDFSPPDDAPEVDAQSAAQAAAKGE